MIYMNGKVYTGEFKDNLRHGTGKMRKVDGTETEYQWYKGESVEKKTMQVRDGQIYTGHVKKGLQHGWGRLTFGA